MHKAKDLIGKEIINQVTGEKVATVRDLMFDIDTRTLTAILVDDNWSRDARVVPWRIVTSIGDVVLANSETPIIIASTEPDLAEQITQDIRVTDMTIINDSGERVGTVSDLFINEAGEVVGYEVSQGFFSSLSGHKFLAADRVRTIGKDAVIADTSDLKPVAQVQQDRTEAPSPSDEQPPRETPSTTIESHQQRRAPPPSDEQPPRETESRL